MNYRLIVFVFLQILIQNVTTCSQEKFDSIYGLNPTLYSGQIFTYMVPSSVKGSQYLIEDNFMQGDIIINNQTFTNLLLNYDVYNQEVILRFESNYKTVTIKLNKEKMDGFTLGKRKFILIKSPGEPVPEIYQYFGDDQLMVLYHWEKELDLSSKSGNSFWSFSKPRKTMYLLIEKQKHRFKNNRTFLSLFEKPQKHEIKTFIKQNKINLKRISVTELNELIKFCNNVSH